MKNKLRRTLFIFCLVVFVGSLSIVGYTAWEEHRERAVNGQVSALVDESAPPPSPTREGPPQVLARYKLLVEQNPDTAGWLRIPDSTIDYVVMQCKEESDRYLRRDFYGNYAGNGCLYIDARCDIEKSDNLLIYGHHMMNGDMFGKLIDYDNESYWRERPVVDFDTVYAPGKYQVVAAFYSRLMNEGEQNYRYYHFFGSENEAEFEEYRDFIKNNACYDTGVDIEYGDRLITLSTCAYHVANGRFAVVAKLITTEEAEALRQEATAAAMSRSGDMEISDTPVPLSNTPWLDNIERVEPRDGISITVTFMAVALVALGVLILLGTRGKRK